MIITDNDLFSEIKTRIAFVVILRFNFKIDMDKLIIFLILNMPRVLLQPGRSLT